MYKTSYCRAFIFTLLLCVINLLAQPSTEKQLTTADSLQNSGQVVQSMKIYNKIVEIWRNEGNLKKSDSLAAVAVALAEKNDLNKEIAIFYAHLGQNANIQSMYPESIKYFEKSLAAALKDNDQETAARRFENIGFTYKDMNLYEQSLSNLFKSLQIREKYGYTERIPNTLIYISMVYDRLNDFNKQQQYVRKALSFIKIHDLLPPRTKGIVFNSAGTMYNNLKLPDSALFYFEQSLKQARIDGWQKGEAAALSNLASIYRQQKRYDKALLMHQEALMLEKKLKNMYGICKELHKIGLLNLHIKNYSEARRNLNYALELAVNNSLLYEQYDILRNMAELYRQTSQTDSAYLFLENSFMLKDSIFSLENKNNLDEMEARYQNESKNRQIELLSIKNNMDRLKLFWGGVVLLLVTGLAVLIIRIQHKKNIYSKNELEQKLLRSQMNPHFIFNALAAIQNFMLKNDPKKAAGYLGSFSALSRSVLTNSAKETVSLEEEIKMLKDYIELEKLRMQDSFDYQIIYDENEELDFIRIPPMMIQPFVENAIKHGLASIKSGGLLKLTIVCHEKHITAEVTDNGVGMGNAEPTVGKKHKSMAMSIFEKRRNLLESKYKKNLSFAINNLLSGKQNESGTRIVITLPIIQ